MDTVSDNIFIGRFVLDGDITPEQLGQIKVLIGRFSEAVVEKAGVELFGDIRMAQMYSAPVPTASELGTQDDFNPDDMRVFKVFADMVNDFRLTRMAHGLTMEQFTPAMAMFIVLATQLMVDDESGEGIPGSVAFLRLALDLMSCLNLGIREHVEERMTSDVVDNSVTAVETIIGRAAAGKAEGDLIFDFGDGDDDDDEPDFKFRSQQGPKGWSN